MKQHEMIELYDIYSKSDLQDKMSFVTWYEINKEYLLERLDEK